MNLSEKHRGPDRTKRVMPKYEDNKVTNAEVASLKRRFSSAQREAKLGSWYAARHSSSLQRDQNSGYHWMYLKGEGNLH